MAGPLVDTQWVEDHLNDLDVRILDICEREVYKNGHAPGAYWVGWEDHLCATVDGIEHMAPPAAEAASIFGAWRLTPETLVVAMDDRMNSRSARAYWLLRLYGHQPVSIMDGAREAWLREGRPLTTEEPLPGTILYPIKDRDDSINAAWADVLAASQGEDIALLDVRRLEEYTGDEVRAKHGGHIPGASHVPWEKAMRDDSHFKSAGELREIYDVADERPVITYCQGGVRAAHTWFVLSELLDRNNVRNYDGSWAEWGNRDDLPVET